MKCRVSTPETVVSTFVLKNITKPCRVCDYLSDFSLIYPMVQGTFLKDCPQDRYHYPAYRLLYGEKFLGWEGDPTTAKG